MTDKQDWNARAEETERNIIEAAEAMMKKRSDSPSTLTRNAAALKDLTTAIRLTMESRAIRMKINGCKCDLTPAGHP